MRRNHGVLLLVFCALATTALLAQVVITSTVVGTVTDPQGAMVSEAKVTLTNLDTEVQWKNELPSCWIPRPLASCRRHSCRASNG